RHPPLPRSTLFPYTTLFRSVRDSVPIRLSKLVKKSVLKIEIIVLIPIEKNNNTAAIMSATTRFVFIFTPPQYMYETISQKVSSKILSAAVFTFHRFNDQL